MPATLTPDALDSAAVRLAESAAWQQIVAGWHLTAEEATPAPPDTRPLLTKSVEQLLAETPIQHGPAPRDRQLPGRIAAVLPDHLQRWRAIGQPDLKPSVQLGYAGLVLQEWGWQNQPYKLRDIRGARCICGAIISAYRLGYGSSATAEKSAAWVMAELRSRGWTDLIGPWNRAPGRTAGQAIALVTAAAHRAALTGH